MVLTYFIPISPVVKLIYWSPSADTSVIVVGTNLLGERVGFVVGAASSELYINKAGGGGVAIAPTWTVMRKGSCHKVFLSRRCWTIELDGKRSQGGWETFGHGWEGLRSGVEVIWNSWGGS